MSSTVQLLSQWLWIFFSSVPDFTAKWSPAADVVTATRLNSIDIYWIAYLLQEMVVLAT